ncbi:MAG: meiotic recombination [Vezdaea aestivalis]|nr:MAG: meiotic recombination [Vezdaea aestivalis]
MPDLTDADTIRILVATDSHVGYNERDPIRGDDSWKSFHEVMCLAKSEEVDMILLAGDLFHENKPSRKAMYQVMRSLRMNCYGDKPCELEMLSDASEQFAGAFNHVNYEDQDINIAIPVFSIHGNHDDPSGEGHLCALDILQVAGLVNYYGRTPESDNIQIKPLLLQKGRTKLALYGMSNVRDERLFRTFRDQKVKFFRPGTQQKNWFNIMSVHQNHTAHTETGYLPENFLPDFMDLIVWGHEHECLIDPRLNPEMNFHVMQPGSSVATSLCQAESVPKHVAVVSVTGKEFAVEKHRLKTVRPFLMKEIILNNEPGMKTLVKKQDNRTEITRHLIGVVDKMIDQASTEWQETQADSLAEDDAVETPLPIIRLRVEYSAPDGGKFECENPQRFSNRFQGKVANTSDVVQFYRKKTGATRKNNGSAAANINEDIALAQVTLDNIQVEKLVQQFLTAQSLTILPQNSFGDAVGQFVDKDDKHAMEQFVVQSLADQIQHLMTLKEVDEDVIAQAMDEHRSKLEELFVAGKLKRKGTTKRKPKPEYWDSDLEGSWEDQPGALIYTDGENDHAMGDDVEVASHQSDIGAPRGRGRGSRGGRGIGTTRNTAATKKTTAPTASRGRKKVAEVVEEEDSDVVMIDDDDEEVVEAPKTRRSQPVRKAPAPKSKAFTASKSRKAPSRAAAPTSIRQSKLNFNHPVSQVDDNDDDSILQEVSTLISTGTE